MSGLAGLLGELLHAVIGGGDHALPGPVTAHHPSAVAQALSGGQVTQGHPEYGAVSARHGFFKDPNVGSGWSYSNGYGGLNLGIRAPSDNAAHGILAQNGTTGQWGMGGAANAYVAPRYGQDNGSTPLYAPAPGTVGAPGVYNPAHPAHGQTAQQFARGAMLPVLANQPGPTPDPTFHGMTTEQMLLNPRY